MQKKQLVIIGVIVTLLSAALIVFLTKRGQNSTPIASPTPAPLPINTIPVSERPFITLTPDSTGRYLFVGVNGAPESAEMDYELVYQAGDKQEGVFGRIDFSREKQPYEKKQLLGSQSAGGKITYHEGITSGSLTTTYGETKLKEQFNFLRFDSEEPSISSSDVRFMVELDPDAYQDNDVIVVTKTFGLPTPISGQLVAGPYGFFGPRSPEGEYQVSLKLPAGEWSDPSLLVYDAEAGEWSSADTKLDGETVSASFETGQVFVVTVQ